MDFVGHKKIKDFSLDGNIADESDTMRLRKEYDLLLDHYMKERGYVPHLELESVFSLSYNGTSFDFKITRYGIYVGKAKAKCYKGVLGNRLIPAIHTSKTRLEKLSKSAESQ
jgi:hypothetical protein